MKIYPTMGELLKINSVNGVSSLDQWLSSVLPKTITQLTTKDCCIALRQQFVIVEIVSFSLQIVKEDPFAGDQFDGELFSCLFRVHRNFWNLNPHLKSELELLASKSNQTFDDDVKREFMDWQKCLI